MTTNNSPNIQWRDLCAVTPWHRLLEIARPLLLCSGAAGAALNSHYGLCSVMLLFGHIAALRSAHGAVHNTLGLPKTLNQAVLYGVSGLLATSCHALELTHKLHHQRCGDPQDVEGRIAHRSFWKACLVSPTYHWQVITAAWRLGDNTRRRAIAMDLGLAILIHTTLLLTMGSAVYWLWLGLAILNGASGLLSVWLFHHGEATTRSGHWATANWLAMGMLYHGEHHRYPAVPTARLGELAKRLKAAGSAPEPLFDWPIAIASRHTSNAGTDVEPPQKAVANVELYATFLPKEQQHMESCP